MTTEPIEAMADLGYRYVTVMSYRSAFHVDSFRRRPDGSTVFRRADGPTADEALTRLLAKCQTERADVSEAHRLLDYRTPAHHRLAHARHRAPEHLADLTTLGAPVTWEADGWTLTASVVDDDEAEPIWGRFTDEWSEGAVSTGPPSPRRFAWYVPEVTQAEHAEGLRRTHGKHEAWTLAGEYVRRDMKADVEPERYGVTVKAERADVTMGEASLWDIDLDPCDRYGYLAECAAELALDAVAEAEDKLATLTGIAV